MPVRRVKVCALSHKIPALLRAAVIGSAWYWIVGAWGDDVNAPSYVLAAVERGTVISSVTGSGQVSAFNQVDVKSRASGDVIYVGVVSGQEVGAGALIAQLDARTAQKAVRDAEANLESARIALEKTKKPADGLSLIQAENALSQARENLSKSYGSGFNAVADAFVELPSVVSGLEEILHGSGVGASGQDNAAAYQDMVKTYDETAVQLKEDAAAEYAAARNSHDESFRRYQSTTRLSAASDIEGLIDESYETSQKIAEAAKSADNLLSFVKDELTERDLPVPAVLTTHRASLAGYVSQTNSRLNSLLAARDEIAGAKRTLSEKTESLEELKGGADSLDIASQELAVRQRENALLDAQEKLADYYIRAPFGGIIAKVDIKKFDSVASGAAAAVLITRQKLAEISLNEVDIAQIKTGQKTTLTFDAVPELSISGAVAEVDTVGTVSQGVVTYNVKISFDAQDERIKPGMSVSAAVITDVKTDVLTVPNSAVKSQNGGSFYVEMPIQQDVLQAQAAQGVALNASTRRQAVEIGIASDSLTEVVSGLKEGDQVIARTINNSVSLQVSQPSRSIFGGPGAGGGFRR